MSFRVEDKYIVNNEDKIKILSFIEKSGFEPEFKNREILQVFILMIKIYLCFTILRKAQHQEKNKSKIL